jgi:hydrogenase nickel incorporation protein HypA/HybF
MPGYFSVHELSIAQSLIEMACEAASREGADRVEKLFLRIGRMSGVVIEALQFSFELAAEGTACAGAILEIEDVPITVRCPQCDTVQTLSDSYHFCCPQCGTPTPDIVGGRELELTSLQIPAEATALGSMQPGPSETQ